MENNYKATIIVSIYNNIKALKTLLDSLKYQSEQSFEIIISEDASHAEVAEFIASYPFTHDFQHLTQADDGWRNNRALNRAVVASRSEYLIFIDGDCILHPRFVELHLAIAASNPMSIISGKRVKLNRELSELLMEDVNNYKIIARRLLKLILSRDKQGNEYVEEGIFLNPESLFGSAIYKLRSMRKIRGCNMSLPKRAILDINGFDEDYMLPAIGEDTDLKWRLEGIGYHICSARNVAVQYHLDHKENWVSNVENKNKMLEKMKLKNYYCINGLNK